jgi:hypothetical protein
MVGEYCDRLAEALPHLCDRFKRSYEAAEG